MKFNHQDVNKTLSDAMYCSLKRITGMILSIRAVQKISFYLMLFCLVTGCKKFVTIDPPKTQLVSKTVFQNDATATAAMLGIYSSLMSSNGSFINTQITVLGGLSADELIDYSLNAPYVETFKNTLSPNNTNILILWKDTFTYIYQANAIIEGIENNQNISSNTKSQLLGEAKLFRALCHFYLVNFFGDIPYIESSDYKKNNTASRLPVSQVYELIITDLLESINLLNEAYVGADNKPYSSDEERIRPNKSTASALLAKVYLYTGDWVNAELQSSKIIQNSSLYSIAQDVNDVFLKNSRESIWQLMPVTPGLNTPEGNLFILTGPPTSFALTDSLINSFETGDYRRSSWIGEITDGQRTYYYPNKYKVMLGDELIEYYTIFRLAEAYLIRAEARARQNNIIEAVLDINIIRSRAGLANLADTIGNAECLVAIEKERRNEMFAELANRWMDLKRLNRADEVLKDLKAPNWETTDILYPIPENQLANDANMTQNPGY